MALPIAALIAGAAASAAGSLGSTAINAAVSQDQAGKSRELSRELQEDAQSWDLLMTQSGRSHEREMAKLNQELNIGIQQRAMDFEKEMASTQYQRAVADMQAAGINPASLSGVQVMPSSAPSVGASGVSSHSSGHSSPGARSAGGSSFSGAHLDFGSSLFESAFNAAAAKDRDIAKIFAQEVVDNAKHQHLLEEAAEKISEKQVLDKLSESYKSSGNEYRHVKGSDGNDYVVL